MASSLSALLLQVLALTSILGKIGHEVAAKTKSWKWIRAHHQPTAQLDTDQFATGYWCNPEIGKFQAQPKSFTVISWKPMIGSN